MYLRTFPPSAQEFRCAAAVSSGGTRLKRDPRGHAEESGAPFKIARLADKTRQTKLIAYFRKMSASQFASGFEFNCSGPSSSSEIEV